MPDTDNSELLIPALFLPYQMPMPGVVNTVRVTNMLNLAGVFCADNTHHKIFVPFLDEIDGMSAEEDACSKAREKLLGKISLAGVVAEIRHIDFKEKFATVDLIVSGLGKALCRELSVEPDLRTGILATVRMMQPDVSGEKGQNLPAARRMVMRALRSYSKYAERIDGIKISPPEFQAEFDNSTLCYRIAAELDFDYEDIKKLIVSPSVYERLVETTAVLNRLTNYAEIEESILQKTGRSITEQQRESFMREQIRIIEEELGDDEAGECDMLEEKLNSLQPYLAEGAYERIEKEISRLRRLSSVSPDYSVLRMHIDFLLGLPWEPTELPDVDLKEVRRILDRDHYGLQKVKDRIVEFMAVRTMKKATTTGIICLFGPPGTGKTSVVKSISEALGREYIRISLGGVRDEAEIRGHRKTYIGAMPGRILTAIEKAKTRTPVILLDEIDKLCGDFRGDPASALLEVLDKEQNKAFTDTYAEVPFDLSGVLFITTANSLDTIPEPLLDRLEVIELSSYTENEKMEIAKRHLIPKQAKEHGLSKNAVTIKDSVVRKLINEYTREAGVRSLERHIAALMRKAITVMKTENRRSVTINDAVLFKMLGAGHAIHRFETGDKAVIGSVNGMAWTSIGGVLLAVEVNVFEGSGKLEVTGLIGDVMRESAVAALSYIRSRSDAFGLSGDFYKTKDIHVHVPEGATPKDGPSAGVTIATAILSALAGIPVKQSVAMTGEITIRGDVLAIGGLKEKTLAALKEGISTVLVPEENSADVAELPEEVRNGLNIITVKTVDEVFGLALVRKTDAAGGIAKAGNSGDKNAKNGNVKNGNVKNDSTKNENADNENEKAAENAETSGDTENEQK